MGQSAEPPVWIGPNGERAAYALIWLGLDDDGHEVYTHRQDGIVALPPDKPLIGDSYA